MSCTDLGEARWYFDESALGPAKLLSDRRDDLVFAGHPLLENVPLGTADTDWIPIVTTSGWVAFCRDRRIRSRPAELQIAREAGLRMVWFSGKTDKRPGDYARMFEDNLPRLERLITKLGNGPWALGLTANGLRPLSI